MFSGNQKIYFPGLNGIRFIAALSVIIWHIEQNKNHFKDSPRMSESEFPSLPLK